VVISKLVCLEVYSYGHPFIKCKLFHGWRLRTIVFTSRGGSLNIRVSTANECV
jgi:hypothetical protein